MFALNVKGDLKSIVREFRKSKDEFPRAASRALNRTADAVRSAAVKSVAQNIGIKQKVARDAIIVKRANFSNLAARVVASGRRIPLFQLAARQTLRGVTYRLRGARRLIPGVFIARMPGSGHAGVFKRRGQSRLPIDELFGPSVPVVFARRQIQKALKQIISDRLPKELNQALNFFRRRAA